MATIIISALLIVIILLAIRSVIKEKQSCAGNCGSCMSNCHRGKDLYREYHQNA